MHAHTQSLSHKYAPKPIQTHTNHSNNLAKKRFNAKLCRSQEINNLNFLKIVFVDKSEASEDGVYFPAHIKDKYSPGQIIKKKSFRPFMRESAS